MLHQCFVQRNFHLVQNGCFLASLPSRALVKIIHSHRIMLLALISIRAKTLICLRIRIIFFQLFKTRNIKKAIKIRPGCSDFILSSVRIWLTFNLFMKICQKTICFLTTKIAALFLIIPDSKRNQRIQF